MGTLPGPEGEELRQKRTRRRWLATLVGGTTVSLLVGASFAATITVNPDGAIEFGQGSQDVVTCATANLVPTFESSYTNAGGFKVKRVLVTGVANACRNKFVLVTLYAAGNTKLDELLFSPDSGPAHTGSFSLDTDTASFCIGTEVPDPVTDPVYCGPEAGGANGLAATTNAEAVVDMTVQTFSTAPTTIY